VQKRAAVGEAVAGETWAAFAAAPWDSSCPWAASAWDLQVPSCPPAVDYASWGSSGRASLESSCRGVGGHPGACPAAEASSLGAAGGAKACHQMGLTPRSCPHSPRVGAASCP
jgi:hypothetical protein